jgi:hypothetical protein
MGVAGHGWRSWSFDRRGTSLSAVGADFRHYQALTGLADGWRGYSPAANSLAHKQ